MSSTAVALGALTALLSAAAFWLSYRDYLRSHRELVEVVREMQQTAPLAADAIAALSPAPPLRRRTPVG